MDSFLSFLHSSNVIERVHLNRISLYIRYNYGYTTDTNDADCSTWIDNCAALYVVDYPSHSEMNVLVLVLVVHSQ